MIALGSNSPDGAERLRQAALEMARWGQDACGSSLYRSRAAYFTQQPDFWNAALTFTYDGEVRTLFLRLKALEETLGRTPTFRNGPREIDLDLIAYGALVVQTVELNIPHPRAAERWFVRLPLEEIAPDLVLPGLGRLMDHPGPTVDERNDVQKTSEGLLLGEE